MTSIWAAHKPIDQLNEVMITLRLLNDIFVRKFHRKKGPVMQALNTPLTSVLAKYHPNGGLCCIKDLNAAKAALSCIGVVLN